MRFQGALLEDWMRDHYHEAVIDIGSSGVLDYSLRQVRELAGIGIEEIDEIVFRDSPCLGRYDLRETIAERYGIGSAERVMMTHGSSEAIYVSLLTLLEPGDQVVTLEPTYHSHVSIAESLGCELLRWRLREEDSFQPDLNDLDAIITKRTKAIVVNFPHNPTGATITSGDFFRLLEIAASVNAYVIWDAALADLVYEGDPLPDPCLYYTRSVSVGTFSKAFGLPGMRLGWCIAPPELIRAATNLRDRITLSLSPLLEYIALRVLQNADSFIRPRRENAEINRRTLIEWALQHEDVLDLPLPHGGVTAFPLLRRMEDTVEICTRLGEDHRVLLIPGNVFGYPRRVRLGFGGERDQLNKGLEILAGELTGSLYTQEGA
jgi:capreomycidine synthase